MGVVRGMLKTLLPKAVRARLRATHQAIIFRRAMRRFLAEPQAALQDTSSVLRDLVRGWGNESYSAQPEYLAACVREALKATGAILECGSGLSTLLVGAVAQRRGLEHWALEHTPSWAARVQDELDRNKLGTVHLHLAPLQEYGPYAWYDPPWDAMPDRFALVICDGPPGDTLGGRRGLLPQCGDRLRHPCVILLDDASREEEQAVARDWARRLGVRAEFHGRAKPYARFVLRH